MKKEPRLFRAPGNGALALAPQALGFLFEDAQANDVEVTRGGVAIVGIEGPLSHKPSWFGDSYESIRARVEAAASDPDVHSIVLKIDSYGGVVSGCYATVDAIRQAAASAGKRLVAYVDEAAFSAAYALACAADEIVIPKVGGVGSIGCLQILVDATGMDKQQGLAFHFVASGEKKAQGNPHAGIDDATLATAQEHVDALAVMFFEIVAESRGISVDAVRALEAGCFFGADAVSKGLADTIASLDEVIDQLEAGAPKPTNKGEPSMRTKKATRLIKSNGAPVAETEEKDEKKKKDEEVAEDEETEETAEEKKDEKKASDEETCEEGEEKEGDDEDEEGEEKAGIGAADILAAVAAITGSGDPAAQLGALHGLAASAKSGTRSRANAAKEQAIAAVDAGVRAGKITSHNREYWLGIASRPGGVHAVQSFLKTAPIVAAPVDGGGYAQPAPGAGTLPTFERAIEGTDAGALTEADRLVMRKMGISEERMRELRAARPSRVASANPFRLVNGGK